MHKTTHQPKEISRENAMKEIVRQINFCKSYVGDTHKESFEKTLEELRTLWKVRDIHRMVKLLNEKKYITGVEFRLVTVIAKSAKLQYEYELLTEYY